MMFRPDRTTCVQQLFSVIGGVSVRSGVIFVGSVIVIVIGRFIDRFSLLRALFSPDGQQLLTSNWDGTARVWSVRSGQRIKVIDYGGSNVYAAAYSPDGSRLALGGQPFEIWDTSSWEQPLSSVPFLNTMMDLAFADGGMRLAAGGHTWGATAGHRG